MGVRGLETFMERDCDGVVTRVNIAQMAQKYREATGRKEAVLVVDGLSVMRYLYTWRGSDGEGEGLSWMNGGQLTEYGERAAQLVRALRSAQVTPVFFFDGPLEPTKVPVWQSRRMQTLADLYRVTDEVARARPRYIPELDTRLDQNALCILPIGTISTLMYFVGHVCGAQVFMTRRECDLEMALYMQENGCMGVLGQDSDFVVHNLGGGAYFSVKHLDMDRLTTVIYDQRRLAHRLSLDPSQLPLLASLVGNDCVPYDDLRDFHRRVMRSENVWGRHGGRQRKSIIEPVARVVRQGQPLSRLAAHVFGDPSKASVLAQSIISYRSLPEPLGDDGGNDVWSRILARATELYLATRLSPFVFQVIRDRLFTVGTNLEDFRIPNTIPSAVILSGARRRMYGVIFYEKEYNERGEPNGANVTIDERAVTGLNCFDQEHWVTPLYPPKSVVHVGLLKVWSDEEKSRSEHVDVLWHLWGYMVSLDTDEIARLRNEIPPHLVILTASLVYILRETGDRVIRDWEGCALMAMGALRSELTTAELTALSPVHFTPKTQTIYTVFGRTVELIHAMLLLCSIPLSVHDIKMFKFMDGKLFQNKYRQAEKLMQEGASESARAAALCDQSVSVLEVYNKIHNFVYDCVHNSK